MRAFIVLCLVAVATADAGYNYGAGFTTGSNSGDSYGSGSIGGGSYSSGGGGGGSIGGPVAYNGGAGDSGYNKEFYTFTAPEHEFNDPNAAQRLAGSLKKNLRVIFIKSPENKGFEDAALALAKNAAEQKTAVYVLHKQPDYDDLASKFNAIRNSNNRKPEVHFVKYRTPEDAANAQRQIQSQYDSLGGSSQSHNGGVAPVINFASQAPAANHGGSSYNGGNSYSGGSAPTGAYLAPQTSYLPASILRRLRFRRL